MLTTNSCRRMSLYRARYTEPGKTGCSYSLVGGDTANEAACALGGTGRTWLLWACQVLIVQVNY